MTKPSKAKQKKIEEVLQSRFIDKIYPSKGEFRKALRSGKKLTIYHGVDPTSPDLHLGHSTNYFFLKQLQGLGHRIVLLVGDFTARIGDPSGRLIARKSLSEKEILKNSKGYKEQVSKILDFTSKTNPALVKFNSEWLEKLSSEEMLKLMANFTLAQVVERDMFQKRIQKREPIHLHEFIYPLLQGYDSVALNTDVEVGGTDQTFNMLMGRKLMRIYKNKEKFVITTPLLISSGSSKKLMSKSERGYIALNESPNNMYGKVMAITDEFIVPCLRLCTEISEKEIAALKKINPRDAKARLAYEIVKLYHGEETAGSAEAEFNRVFQKKKLPTRIPVKKIKKQSIVLDELIVAVGGAKSKSEAKRLVNQGAVRLDYAHARDPKEKIKIPKNGILLQVGKRKFVRVKT